MTFGFSGNVAAMEAYAGLAVEGLMKTGMRQECPRADH